MHQIPTPSNKGQEGQVAFEFLLVFSFAMGLTFMFLFMSTNYVAGYLAHYATFMSSRTFLVADDGGRNTNAVLSYAENRAREVFSVYQLETFKINTQNLNVIRPAAGNKAIYVGVNFSFQKLLSPMKFVGGQEKATFFTESLLGKEPMRRTCFERTCTAMGHGTCNMNMDITMFDNGC